jgi:ABC-2 type transport system ATP-binding protein
LGEILNIQNLSKRYGKIQAVDNLSFTLKSGHVYGILGPNGSGKTTTLGIILDVINASSGNYRWFEKEPSKESRKRIGAILEQPLFYPYLTADKNLHIIADIKGVNYDDIERVLKIVELYDRRDSKFKTFSYGMKQRLAIAAALLGNPGVLIFDEPTNGLDPKGIAEIRELILKIAKKGITIILASHLLDEVQKTCSHVIVLNKGQKLFEGGVDNILNLSDTVELSSGNNDILELALKEFNSTDTIKRELNLILITLKDKTTTADLNEFLISKGIVLSHLALRKKNLEQQFLELLSNKS